VDRLQGLHDRALDTGASFLVPPTAFQIMDKLLPLPQGGVRAFFKPDRDDPHHDSAPGSPIWFDSYTTRPPTTFLLLTVATATGRLRPTSVTLAQLVDPLPRRSRPRPGGAARRPRPRPRSTSTTAPTATRRLAVRRNATTDSASALQHRAGRGRSSPARRPGRVLTTYQSRIGHPWRLHQHRQQPAPVDRPGRPSPFPTDNYWS